MDKFNWINPKDTKAINRKLASIVKSYGTVRKQLHELLDAGAAHYVAHGDASILTSVIEAVPMMARPVQIWIETFVNVTWRKDKNGVAKFLRKKEDKANTYQQEQARATPFWELQKAKDAAAPIDYAAKIEAIISKGMNALKEGKEMSDDSKNAIVWYSRHPMPKGFVADAVTEGKPVAARATKPQALAA